MPSVDAKLIFSDGQSLINATGDLVSTDVLDMGAGGAQVGAAQLYLVADIGTAVDSAADGATLQIVLADGATATPTAKIQSGEIMLEANLTANASAAKFPIRPDHLRYLRAIYTIAGEAITAGTITTYLTSDPEIRF